MKSTIGVVGILRQDFMNSSSCHQPELSHLPVITWFGGDAGLYGGFAWDGQGRSAGRSCRAYAGGA